MYMLLLSDIFSLWIMLCSIHVFLPSLRAVSYKNVKAFRLF